MEQERLSQIIKEISENENIGIKDIPDLELYMEQVTGFMDDKLKKMKRSPEDKILTKTMINNYTKAGILMPPNKKKYNKEHIILMILVYNLKQILSLEDIKRLFAPILNDMDTTEDDLISIEEIYAVFNDLKVEEMEMVEPFIERNLNNIEEKTKNIKDKALKNEAEMFLLVINLIAQANALKNLSEKIIDEYF